MLLKKQNENVEKTTGGQGSEGEASRRKLNAILLTTNNPRESSEKQQQQQDKDKDQNQKGKKEKIEYCRCLDTKPKWDINGFVFALGTGFLTWAVATYMYPNKKID